MRKLIDKLPRNIRLLVLVLLCLTPILWFIGRGQVLITGLDTNFPLDPIIWFTRRLFVWNSTINAGTDFSSSTSGIFFHLVQVIPHLLKSNLQTTEIVSLIFWFSAIIISSYLFARTIYRENFLGQILFVVSYSFNIYLFNTWENVKVSNLALMASLPLFLGIVYLWKRKTISLNRVIFYSATASIVASGTGINPAYFASLAGAILLFILVSSVFDRKDLKSFLAGSLTCLAVLFLVNLFWILPLTYQLFISKRINDLNDIGLTNWLDSLSQNTSLLNVFRLQGAWDWYATDDVGLPLYIPYAVRYFRSLPFVVFSFAIPFFALVSLAKHKKDERILYVSFAILLILGVFLGAGTHEPTGQIYEFLNSKVPFLSFFRSPWYIFTPYLIISFAGLSLLLFKRLNEESKHKRILYIMTILFIAGNFVYNYPLVLGRIFRAGRYDSFYVKFPYYVFESGKWLNQNRKSTGRIVTYPDDQLETFKWGYRGTESIISLFSDAEVIAPSFNYTSRPLGLLLEEFYFDIKRGDYDSAFSTLRFLGVDTIFSKNDSNSLSGQINEQDFSIVSRTFSTRFGEWSFLQLKEANSGKIHSPKFIYKNFTGPETFSSLAKILPSDSITIGSGDTEASKITTLMDESSGLIKVTNKDFTKNIGSNNQEYWVTVPKDGIYNLIIKRKGSKKNLDDFSGTIVSIDSTNEVKIDRDDQNDGFFNLASLNLKSGDYKLAINFPVRENLLNINDFTLYSPLPNLRVDELPVDTKKTLVVFDSNAKNGLIKIPVPGFDPFHNYLLTFDSKYFYGNVPVVEMIQSAPTAPVKVTPLYAGSATDWQHQLLPINPIPVDSKLEIFIKAGSNKNNRSKSFMENFSIKKVYDNELFLKQDGDLHLDTPDVRFNKISPVEYAVEVSDISGPYFIAFLENYDSGWMLTSDTLEKPIHFSVNGYANAWYLNSEKTEQKLKIYYQPQQYFVLGAIASGLTIAGAVIFRFKK